MSDELNLLAPRFTLQGEAGADLSLTINLPFDATGGTHELVIAETATGAAISTLTSGSGLTVGSYADGVTPVAVLIARAFTAAHPGERLFFSYRLTLSSLKRPYAKGVIVIEGDIT